MIISQNGKYLFSYQHTVLVLVTEENDDSDNLRYCKPTFICDREPGYREFIFLAADQFSNVSAILFSRQSKS